MSHMIKIKTLDGSHNHSDAFESLKNSNWMHYVSVDTIELVVDPRDQGLGIGSRVVPKQEDSVCDLSLFE